MKSLFKIIRRYMATAAGITVTVLVLNIIILLGIGYRELKEVSANHGVREKMDLAGEELRLVQGRYEMSPEGFSILKRGGFEWVMLIDGSGQVQWSWQLPQEVPLTYTMADISVLSKWYVADYPVSTWTYGDGVMVFAQDKKEVARFNPEMSISLIQSIPRNLAVLLLGNIFMITALAMVLGYRFYHSLKPIAWGIERLPEKETVVLPEKGITDQLARKLNEASRILEQQEKRLSQRDNTRNTWISGVSHDIRTPLSLIMGYADGLARDESLDCAQRRRAGAIQRQSLQIKKLIEDLNLTSKLEYGSYPLRVEEYSPAALLRGVTADYYNDGLGQGYEIRLDIQSEVEGIRKQGDKNLLVRAWKNLIGNSIRHNREWCTIWIEVRADGQVVEYTFKDSGPGIPLEVAEALSFSENREGMPHIMGLRVVKQIVEAHGGRLKFLKRAEGTADIRVYL